MAKQQRLTFIISKNKVGKMVISMEMYPPPSKDADAFYKLPIEQQEIQSAAAQIGKFAMEKMAALHNENPQQKTAIIGEKQYGQV